MRRELAGHERTDQESRRQLDRLRQGEADERRDRGVLPALAEERGLERRVRALERLVVPVEPAARFGCGDEESDEHRAEERVVLGRARPRVGVGEDRRRGLAAELLEREPGVLADAQGRLPLLDERTDQRTELVQHGASALDVLLEGEGKLGSLLEVAAEHDERAEHEAPEDRIQVRRAHRHWFQYASDAGLSSFPG